MRETRADTQRALVEALGLHVLLFALVYFGLHWTRFNAAEPAAGEPIEADLVDASALSAQMQRALQRTPEAMPQPPVEQPVEAQPEPLPQPVQEEQALPPPVPEPAPVEQEKVQRDAPTPTQATREQEEKRKPPPQVDLDASRRAEQERKKLDQLAEIRRQRELASKQTRLAEQRAQQLADARAQTGTSRASPPPGQRGTDDGLKARYIAALDQAIRRQWVKPDSVTAGMQCKLIIRQLPGGDVVKDGVSFASPCQFDAAARESIERAVLKAAPLPYAGFETVFDRQLNLLFEADGN